MQEHGETALHMAAVNGHAEVVKELLKAQDIDVNLKNVRDLLLQHPPYSRFVRVHMLCSYIYKFASARATRFVVLRYVTGVLRSIVEIVRRVGIRGVVRVCICPSWIVSLLSDSLCTCFGVPCCRRDIMWQIVQEDGNTALHIAARGGHAEIVEALLSKDGIDVNLQDVRDLLLQCPPYCSRSHMVVVYIQVCVCSHRALRRCVICDGCSPFDC